MYLDLTGKTIGKWFVIESLPKKAGKGQIWRCRCACGVIRHKPTYRLIGPGQCQKCSRCNLLEQGHKHFKQIQRIMALKALHAADRQQTIARLQECADRAGIVLKKEGYN